MKNLISHPIQFGLLGVICCIPLASALGADTNSAPAGVATPTVVTSPTPSTPDSNTAAKTDSAKLPYGVADVVKLSRSQVSEDVIVSYVQNSGTAYSLGSDDIVRLRNEGVSDRVINTMLDQHKKAVDAAQIAAAPAPVYSDNTSSPAVSESQPAQNSAPAEAPLTPPASSTYVIPYPPATAPYYGYPSYYYPYYPYYYGGYYGGPIVSFRFGFGGGHGGHFHHHR